MTLISYRYYDDLSTRKLKWVPRQAVVNELPKLCGVSSGGVVVSLLIGKRWVNQPRNRRVVPSGHCKFEGNFTTKEEKAEKKRKRDLQRKGREKKRKNSALLEI